MIHDGAKHHGLEIEPVEIGGLAHRDEIGAEINAGHALEREQAFGERRGLGRLGLREIGRAGVHDRTARQELEGRRIGGRLGLDEHRRLLGGFKARGQSGTLPV